MKLPTIPPGLGGNIENTPALGTNQITGFGGFRPLASLEKNKFTIFIYTLSGSRKIRWESEK